MQDTSRKRKVMLGGGESGWILTLLRQLQPFIIATSRLLRPVSLQRYIDHRHASRCPHGGGRVIKKAMDFSDASGEKPVNTRALCCSSLSAMQEFLQAQQEREQTWL